MKIKWRSFNNTIGSEQTDVLEIDDAEIEGMRESGYTEKAIEEWIDQMVKEEVMNYFEWSYEVIS